MCVDANAGARAAARERARQKDAQFAIRKLQFFNKEVSLSRAQNRNIMGYSRDLSDAYVRAVFQQGKGRLQSQALVAKYLGSKKFSQGGRSTKYGKKQYLNMLRKQAEIEGVVGNLYGRNMALARTGARRRFQAQDAMARQKLGVPAAYGAPVMLPPTDRLTGALGIAGQLIGMASGISNIMNPPSDIKLKENIEEVGVSPQGYKIYEFNYIGGDVRFRGAMAQDVLKKNPMAVGIDQNHLTVDYRQIDVNMEVV